MILERINIMNTKLKHLQIGDLTARLPIIQGGMGVGVSLSKLAGAVAKDEKICEACIFCYSGMLEAPGYILCGKIPEQKSYSKLEFETGLDGSKS